MKQRRVTLTVMANFSSLPGLLFVLLASAHGSIVQQRIGLDSPDANAPFHTRTVNEDDTVEIKSRLPSKDYESDDALAASEVVREAVKDVAQDESDEFIHEEHELGEEASAKFVFVPVGLAIVIALFLGAVVARAKIGWLPESAVTIAVGVGLGIWMKATIGKIPFFLDEDTFNETCSTLLNLFLLPILMFETGWSTRYKDFASQFHYIMLFAVVGSLMSFLVVGCCIYQTGQWGLHSVKMPRTAFAYASLIAATDPVATLAVYTELKVDPLLNILVFGDSIFNDAVAIVLFKVLNDNRIMGTVDSRPSLGELSQHISFGIFSIFFGSVLVGLIVGAVFLLTLRFMHMRAAPRLEVLSLLAVAFICFSLAEAVEMSGIIATMFCSMLIGLYGRLHITQKGSLLGTYFLQQLARLMDTSIFLLVGFCTVNLGKKGLVFGAWAMLFCLAGRAASVFPVAIVTNQIKKSSGRGKQISPKSMFMMWHAALRGAISLTLSMQLGDWVDTLDGPGTRHIMQTGTYLLIIVFLFVFGGSTELFLEKLKIPMKDETKDIKPDDLYMKELSDAQRAFLDRVDQNFLMPVLVGGKDEASDLQKGFEADLDVDSIEDAFEKYSKK